MLNWVTTYLAIGPKPDPSAWTALDQARISMIIDLNNDSNERLQAQHLGLQYRGLKVPDPTEVEDFQTAFPKVNEWIEEEQVGGGKVYLHCTAGVYRSPTFAMAYLMSRGESSRGAESIVKKAHRQTWTSGDVDTLRRALHLWELRQQLPRQAE